MAAVVGVGVARDRAGTASPHIALPRLQSSRHHHNDNSSSPDLLNLTSTALRRIEDGAREEAPGH